MGEQHWHVDNALKGITVMVPLEDIYYESGSLELLPGSHHLGVSWSGSRATKQLCRFPEEERLQCEKKDEKIQDLDRRWRAQQAAAEKLKVFSSEAASSEDDGDNANQQPI